jgi:hypothetical protein
MSECILALLSPLRVTTLATHAQSRHVICAKKLPSYFVQKNTKSFFDYFLSLIAWFVEDYNTNKK